MSRTAPSVELLYAPSDDWDRDRVANSCGVGIDCHSRFIQVFVLLPSGAEIRRREMEFPTTWNDLLDARLWCLRQLADDPAATARSS